MQCERPVDHKCTSLTITEQQALTAQYAHITFQPHRQHRIELPLKGVGAPGSYTVRVTYDGAGAPQDGPVPLFQGRLVSAKAAFSIAPAPGVDRQLIDRWRELAQEDPWCMFPVGLMEWARQQGMEWEHFLIREYPASSFAANGIAGSGARHMTRVAPAVQFEEVLPG